jgi:hypothetical protein
MIVLAAFALVGLAAAVRLPRGPAAQPAPGAEAIDAAAQPG